MYPPDVPREIKPSSDLFSSIMPYHQFIFVLHRKSFYDKSSINPSYAIEYFNEKAYGKFLLNSFK